MKIAITISYIKQVSRRGYESTSTTKIFEDTTPIKEVHEFIQSLKVIGNISNFTISSIED